MINFFFSNGSEFVRNVIQWQQLFSQKITKNRQAAGAPPPDPHSHWRLPPDPVNDKLELQYTSLLNTSLNSDIFTV